MIPFDGWLIKDGRVRELIKIEQKYEILEMNNKYQVSVIDLYEKDNNALKKDVLSLNKKNTFLINSNKIWITTSAVCISFTVITIAGLIIFFSINNYTGGVL